MQRGELVRGKRKGRKDRILHGGREGGGRILKRVKRAATKQRGSRAAAEERRRTKSVYSETQRAPRAGGRK